MRKKCKNYQQILAKLSTMHFGDRLLLNETLKKHTTFLIGGESLFFVYVENAEEIQNLIDTCKDFDLPYFILGNGSNVLADSKGYCGLIISTSKMQNITVKGEKIIAEAGAKIFQVANIALQNNLTGLEWSVGIPGSIGGATKMNAGAFGGEMSQVIESVEVLTNGEIKNISKQNIFFNYRKTIFTNCKDYVIIRVHLKLHLDEIKKIFTRMESIKAKRISTQNVGYPSAGSVFNNTEIPPAYMIDRSGLKGLRVGQAMVSSVHSGFIVNVGNASSDDVWSLIKKIRKTIYNEWNENLDLEIIRLGG